MDASARYLNPTLCPICDKQMARTRDIWRAFQDDMTIWECPDCGVSLTQTVKVEKLVDRLPGSMRSN
jgi:hypothetical protein